jgi:hypothetical protein
VNEITDMAVIEPSEWFVVFHRKSVNRILSFLAFGEFKHVSAFGYCPGVKLWLLYEVKLSGTRVMLLDKSAVMAWTEGCDILKIAPTGKRMEFSSRLGFTCVNAVKHLLGLVCVAVTPDQLYRHILRNGGLPIHGRGPSPAAAAPGRSDARAGAAAGAK